MTDDTESRRQERLQATDWKTGIAASHEELEDYDFEFWLSQPAAIRLQECFNVSREAWSIRGETNPATADAWPYGVRSMNHE
ncbi:MAG: hypothetical protein H6714_10615 [Myxococcales bacterium]|nr:hypothetical protein [Myxococcales bacterium]